MTKPNKLITAVPYPVEQALKRLGADLRIARLRRNLTIEEIAGKIGTGTRAIRDAEKGKPSTSIAVYTALLWVFDFLEKLNDVTDPAKDEEGQIFAIAHERSRARPNKGTDNDF